MVDPHAILAWEDGMGFEGADGNEMTDPVTPELRAMTQSIGGLLFQEAGNINHRCYRSPERQCYRKASCCLKTYGRRVDDMIIKAPVAVRQLRRIPNGYITEKRKLPAPAWYAAILRSALIRAQYKKKLE